MLSRITQQMQPLQEDLECFIRITGEKSELYKTTNQVTTEEIFFWYKSLTRSLFAFADALATSLRSAVIDHAAELEIHLSNTTRKSLLRRGLSTRGALALSLTHFPRLFALPEIALPQDSEPDGQALQLLIECRDGFAHPKSMRDFYPPALLPTALPVASWVLFIWVSLLSACLETAGGQPAAAASRGHRFDGSQVAEFEKRLKSLYEASDQPMFMRMVLALTKDTDRALKLVPRKTIESPFRPWAIRNLARSLFSAIEGTAFILADFLADCGSCERPTANFLRGQDEDVRERIADVLDQFSHLVGDGCKVPRAGPGWENFPQARRFRDRTVHPDPQQSLDCGEVEFRALLETLDWWHVQGSPCLRLDPEKYAES